MTEPDIEAQPSGPRRPQDDPASLESALAAETDPFLVARYTFYLAQSYRDRGEREKALANYEKRATLGYAADEAFVSLYEAAKLKRALGRPLDEVIAACEQATRIAPSRGEALHFAAVACRLAGRNEEGFQFAKRGLDLAGPIGDLFVEPWIYDYGLLDELAVNGYWSRHYRASLDACLKMLGGAALPEGERARIAQNARFAGDKLRDAPNLGSLGAATLADQHRLAPERALRPRLKSAPRVLVAILAKQKEPMLPLFLDCIEALDYPKSSIVLYVRTNNNTDGTERILRDWVDRIGGEYASVEFDAENVAEPVERFGAHEWNATRFRVLGRIRNISLQRALDRQCEFYFVADVDNFIRPSTLRELVALNLPIVAPLLRTLAPGAFYSNYHAEVDANGYYKGCDQYQWILNRWIRGVVEVPVVHTTYLVRADVIPELSYQDRSNRFEYVVFSDTARKAGVPQYIDNRQVYGYIAFDEAHDLHVSGGIELARSYLAADFAASRGGALRAATPRLFACFGLHGSGSTWTFNLAREICRAAGVPFLSFHRDSKAKMPWDAPGSPLLIDRTHNPMQDLQDYVVDSGAPAVISVRDPRDALVSFRQRFSRSLARDFDAALQAIAHSARTLVAMHKRRRLPVFRYEDGFIGRSETFAQIAALLGVEIDDAQRDAILADLTPEAVRKAIAALEDAGAIRGEAEWDRETHWHANHVGDGRIGKFADALSPEEQQRIGEETREYCELFGYPVAAPAHGGAGRAGGVNARRVVENYEPQRQDDASSLPTEESRASAASLLPGISFVVRVRNEEATLERSLRSLDALTIPYEVVVVLHLCTDRSREIAERFRRTRIFEYAVPVSRAGFETLATSASSPHSLMSYYDWCFAKAEHVWCFKWDADHIASPALVDFLNGGKWDDANPARIRFPAVFPDGKRNIEPWLFNAGRRYAKYVFWEYNGAIFAPNVREENRPEAIEHASPLDDSAIKSYWRAPPWFESDDSAEAAELRRRYQLLTELFGPEPVAMARASNPACDALYAAVRKREDELRALGVELWK